MSDNDVADYTDSFMKVFDQLSRVEGAADFVLAYDTLTDFVNYYPCNLRLTEVLEKARDAYLNAWNEIAEGQADERTPEEAAFDLFETAVKKAPTDHSFDDLMASLFEIAENDKEPEKREKAFNMLAAVYSHSLHSATGDIGRLEKLSRTEKKKSVKVAAKQALAAARRRRKLSLPQVALRRALKDLGRT